MEQACDKKAVYALMLLAALPAMAAARVKVVVAPVMLPTVEYGHQPNVFL